MKKSNSYDASLWKCRRCGSWWCSQMTRKPTRLLIDLPISTLELYGWENFRGWRLGGIPSVATCPVCGNINEKPEFGEAIVAPPLKTDLTQLLFPSQSLIRQSATIYQIYVGDHRIKLNLQVNIAQIKNTLPLSATHTSDRFVNRIACLIVKQITLRVDWTFSSYS